MSSAFFLTTSDDPEDARPKIFEGNELGEALIAFISATNNCEAAELKWSS